MTDLCALADVKAWLGPGMGATDDALLTRLITAASSAMQSWMSRNIPQASYTDTRSGNGRQALTLWNTPIIAVSALTVDGNTVPAAPAPAIKNYGFSFDGDTIYLRGYLFGKGQMNVTIQYTAGYAVVPVDLAQACIELVVYRYRERERIGMASKAMAGETTAYTVADFPKSTVAIMNNYRRMFQA